RPGGGFMWTHDAPRPAVRPLRTRPETRGNTENRCRVDGGRWRGADNVVASAPPTTTVDPTCRPCRTRCVTGRSAYLRPGAARVASPAGRHTSGPAPPALRHR